MRWTHVWMRDGILPLNRERLETTSTVKHRSVRWDKQCSYSHEKSSSWLPSQMPPASLSALSEA